MSGKIELRETEEKIKGEKKEQFECFQSLLLEYNQKYNLTAITDEKEIFYKHFSDSAAGVSLFPEKANVCEVGSGAGFPSIPLKILREDLKFTLIESVGKKCEFLNVAVEKLGLKNVTVLNKRAEDVAKEMRETFDVCCARAVARLCSLLEYCMPLVRVGGKVVAYKARAEEEIKEAKVALKTFGGNEFVTYEYELAQNMGERTLVTAEKVRKTPMKYPRGMGKERSNPVL